MTLTEMASAIRNNVSGGLREVYNHAYSIPQLEDEINLARGQLILEASADPINFNKNAFLQKQENLPIELVRFPYEGYSNSPERVPHCQIPKLAMTADNSALVFFGPPDFSLDFKKYFDESFVTHQYSRVISKRPFVYVDMAISSGGKHDAYVFNIESNNLRNVSIRGIFANPIGLLEERGIFARDEEYPAPPAIQEAIIDKLTAKYVEYYRKMNMGYQPNTQTDTK